MLTVRHTVDKFPVAMKCERPRAHISTRPARRHRDMNTRLIISLLCAGALAFACGPRSHSEPEALNAAPATRVTTKTAEHRRHAQSKDHPLDSRLAVAVKPGQVQFALDVENIGTKHVEIRFPTGKAYDFIVVDSIGRKVWTWSDGRMFTQGVRNKQLGSGDTMNVSEEWKLPRKAGRYTAIATVLSSNYPMEERVDFVVP